MNQQLISELSPDDELLGTTKWPHARRLLAQEIARARRYSFPVALVILAIADWDDVVERRGRAEMLQVLQLIGRRLRSTLREQDTCTYVGHGRFALLLTQTGLEGAHIVAERARGQLLAETRLTLRAGIAEFPNDAVTDETLVSEAEAALTVAESTGSPVMSRLLLSEA
ncbi:MAG: diguanylate cyclase, partial [Chloroflexi bacterium]|nr:diguanylate cyclase [Chloroflexota bacterium]